MRIGGGAVSIADVTDRAARDIGFVRPFWLSEIRAGRAFTRGRRLAASGGNFGEIQLINPAGSGITVIVHRLVGSMQTSAQIQIRQHNANLLTDVGTGFNLLSGGAASVAHIRTAIPAALDGTLNIERRVLTAVNEEWLRDWAYELGAGEGIFIAPNSVNVELAMAYEWIEV